MIFLLQQVDHIHQLKVTPRPILALTLYNALGIRSVCLAINGELTNLMPAGGRSLCLLLLRLLLPLVPIPLLLAGLEHILYLLVLKSALQIMMVGQVDTHSNILGILGLVLRLSFRYRRKSGFYVPGSLVAEEMDYVLVGLAH